MSNHELPSNSRPEILSEEDYEIPDNEKSSLPRWMWVAAGGINIVAMLILAASVIMMIRGLKNRSGGEPEQVVEMVTEQPASPAAPAVESEPAPEPEPKSESVPAIEVPVDPQVHVDELNAEALKELRPYYAAAQLFEGIDTSGWPALPRDIGPNIVSVTIYELDQDGAELTSQQEVPIYLQNWSNVFAAYVASGMPVQVPSTMGMGLLPECEQLSETIARASADPEVVFAVVSAIRNADPETLKAVGLDSLESGTELEKHWEAVQSDFRDLEYEVGRLRQEGKTPQAIEDKIGARKLAYLDRYVEAGRGNAGADQIAQYKWAVATLSARFDKTAAEKRVRRAHYELRLMSPSFPHRDEMITAVQEDWVALHPQS